MNVAIIGSRGYPSTYGGFETLVRALAPDLVQRGHRVTVYGRAGVRRHRRRDVGNVSVVDAFGLDTKSLSTLSFGLTSSLDAATRRYDVALVVNVANGFYVPLLRAARIPSVINVDGLEWLRGKWGRIGRRVFRQGAASAARFANALVADSRAIADFWEAEFGVTPHFIPYGAPLAGRQSEARIRSLGLNPDGYVLVVARLVPENNVELTLDAISLLRPPVPVVVVGAAVDRSPISSRLADLERIGAVRWLGHVSDQALLTDLWAHAGVYVHGHSVGGTNPALLQALGAGAPTLAYPSVFNQEVLAHPSHLYEPTPPALASRIAEVMRSPELREQLRVGGRRRVETAYSWASVCADYERLLAEVAGGGRG